MASNKAQWLRAAAVGWDVLLLTRVDEADFSLTE